MSRSIVNGTLLAGFIGKEVTIFGEAQEASPRSNSFKMRTTDNLIVTINLKSPLTKPLEGYVVVHGNCISKSIIEAEEFFCFSTTEFDSTNYNVTCKLLQVAPNVW